MLPSLLVLFFQSTVPKDNNISMLNDLFSIDSDTPNHENLKHVVVANEIFILFHFLILYFVIYKYSCVYNDIRFGISLKCNRQ